MSVASESSAFGIHWFRRDLRIAGNPALQANWKQHNGRVLGLFCFDPVFLARSDFGHNRFGFFLKTLTSLRDELREEGGDLLFLGDGPKISFEKLFFEFHRLGQAVPTMISWNRDYEPFARERDRIIERYLVDEVGIRVQTERDHLVFEPHEIAKSGGDAPYYQVFSPFARRWFESLADATVGHRLDQQRSGIKYLDRRSRGDSKERLFSLRWDQVLGSQSHLHDVLNETIAKNESKISVTLPEVGTAAALARLRKFARAQLKQYPERRDIPSDDGTSQLSIYFKNGSITSTMVLAELAPFQINAKGKDGLSTFIREIAWREFYYHILFHVPRVEHESFLPKYQNIAWENREDYFRAWCEGQTGYPIVDAGMRQLLQTGWMHNRVRMIVASFLTKDLHISWQWGERFFMQHLLDGDLAPNNGGWQWAASTGCDPQPYFRIFNPLLQSKRFDPDGVYIKRFIPELAQLPSKAIHEPHAMGERLRYPRPIVDHAEQKELALELYTAKD